jgi:hypothetical protein
MAAAEWVGGKVMPDFESPEQNIAETKAGGTPFEDKISCTEFWW